MIGRRCTHGNVFSRPVLIARKLFLKEKHTPKGQRVSRAVYQREKGRCERSDDERVIRKDDEYTGNCTEVFFSQVIYCGGYSGGEPPLPIPNREVKPVIADGTAPPGGRVGSRRSSTTRPESNLAGLFFLYSSAKSKAWTGNLGPPSGTLEGGAQTCLGGTERSGGFPVHACAQRQKEITLRSVKWKSLWFMGLSKHLS